jgi:hypothetical protein
MWVDYKHRWYEIKSYLRKLVFENLITYTLEKYFKEVGCEEIR